MWAAINGIASLKITPMGSTSVTLPDRVEGDPLGGVHPRVGRDHRDAAEDARHGDRHAGPEVRPWLQPAPAEDVDGDEDGLGEEEDPLEGERHAERRAPLAHELGPQQAELEGEHGPGHRSHGERHRHVLRPALSQQHRVPVIVLDAAVVGDQRHHRPRHPERHQDDVEREREGHLRPRPRHRIDSQGSAREGVSQHGGSPAWLGAAGRSSRVVMSSTATGWSAPPGAGPRRRGRGRRTVPGRPSPPWSPPVATGIAGSRACCIGTRASRAASSVMAASIRARWVNACGKLPSCSPVSPISSE